MQASNFGQEAIINNNLNKYFQNNDYNTYEAENIDKTKYIQSRINSINGNIKYIEYNIENNQGYEQNLNNDNNQFDKYFENKFNNNSINTKEINVPKTYFYSYDYNYQIPSLNNYLNLKKNI